MILYQQHNSSVPYNYDAMDYESFEYIPHLHRDPELICMLQGEMIATIEDRKERLREGQFALILPNQVHSFTTPESSLVRVIVFAEEYVREFRQALGNRICKTNGFFMPPDDRAFFLRKINGNTPDRMDICACLSLACGAFLRQKDQEGWETGADRKTDLLHSILSYISTSYTEPITLKKMADTLGYEEHYLSRCFHRLFHKNFRQFINEYRINHARYLLSDPSNGLSVTEIAFASGFQSVRNFNRVYRETVGNNPRNQDRTLPLS